MVFELQYRVIHNNSIFLEAPGPPFLKSVPPLGGAFPTSVFPPTNRIFGNGSICPNQVNIFAGKAIRGMPYHLVAFFERTFSGQINSHAQPLPGR
jgi:hypothetical protein